MSLSNALESEEDDTDPTRSFLNDNNQKQTPRNGNKSAPQKPTPRQQSTHLYGDNMDADEASDLETISQLLSERTGAGKKGSSDNKAAPRKSPRSGNYYNNTAGSNVSEMRKKIEKQLDPTSKQPRPKPSPNAVPIGFRDENGNVSLICMTSSYE